MSMKAVANPKSQVEPALIPYVTNLLIMTMNILKQVQFFYFLFCVRMCTRVINTFDSVSPPDDEQDAYNDKHNMMT